MKKIVFNDTFDYGIDDSLVKIVDDPDQLSKKVASDIRHSWGKVDPQKGRTMVHIIALGAFEKTGQNSNGDCFEEAVCKKSHPDFIKSARLYRHHKKTAEQEKDGDVIKSAYNDKMGRVELLISAIDDRCGDWLGKLEKNGSVNFSMGWSCTDGDICTICDHRAHKRSEYCDHLKKNASAPYGLGKILPDGRQCGTYNRDGFWNDISFVDRGADMIAMDLAKVASAGVDEVIGGAELAEMFGYCEDEKLSNKTALAHRVYDLFSKVKNGSFYPMCLNSISEKTANDILSNQPKEIFGYFQKNGYVMPFDLFCRSIHSAMNQEAEENIKNAKSNFAEYSMETYSNSHKMDALSKVGTFDVIIPRTMYLEKTSSEELKYNNNCIYAGNSILNGTSSILEKVGCDNNIPKTKPARALVEGYIAYKIATLADKELHNQNIFDLFLLN